MKLGNSGVIAITSTLLFACTMTETTTTTSRRPNQDDNPADVQRMKLALSKRASAKQSVVSALGGAKGKAKGMKTLSNGAGRPGACGLSTGDATCDACLDTSCCAQNTACVSNADCSALVTCLGACNDDTCANACLTAHPNGANLLGTLGSCVESSCSTACGGAPPPPPSGSTCGFASGDTSCDTCLDNNCCGDANACLNDVDCTALLDCEWSCTDATCAAACEAAHPSGAAKLNSLAACANNTCGAACTGGGGGGGGGRCGLTSGAATCDACLDGSCCAPTTTCLGNPDCVALVTCYAGCGTEACLTTCDAAHPSGQADLGAVFSCVQTSCTTACGL